MDISNLTVSNPTATSTTRTPATPGTNKLAAQGIVLPEVRQANTGSSRVQSSEDAVSQPNTKELGNLVSQANATLQARSSDLKFTVDDASDISVVRIEDTDTGELIRQIPSEAMLAIAQALEEFKQGSVLEEKV